MLTHLRKILNKEVLEGKKKETEEVICIKQGYFYIFPVKDVEKPEGAEHCVPTAHTILDS